MNPPLTSIVSLLCALFVMLASDAHAQQRPNIVLIMADDMGYECVGADGETIYKTPRLDELAKQGVRFTHGHATPICTPTRVQIMSGLYNSRNYTRFGHMSPDITTFANMFQDAGYATCVVGKWQLDGGYRGPKNFGFKGPGHYGFDEYCLWQLTRTNGNKPNRFANPGLEVNGETKDYKNGEYGPNIVSDYACGFIDMLPTMLDAAHIDMPKGFKPDGRSFLPQVKGEVGNPRDWVYCYYSPGKKEFAMNKQFKLYKSGKFYDLLTDRVESSPISQQDRTAEQQRAAKELLKVIENHTRK